MKTFLAIPALALILASPAVAATGPDGVPLHCGDVSEADRDPCEAAMERGMTLPDARAAFIAAFVETMADECGFGLDSAFQDGVAELLLDRNWAELHASRREALARGGMGGDARCRRAWEALGPAGRGFFR